MTSQAHELPLIAAGEDEDSREALPTKPIEQTWRSVDRTDRVDTNVPVGGYDAHEGFIVRRTPYAIEMAVDTPAMRAQLEQQGATHESGGVPFTGATSSDLLETHQGRRLMQGVVTELNAIDKGLREPDWDSLTAEQQKELQRIGCDQVGDTPLFRGSTHAMEVPGAAAPGTEEWKRQMEHVGTFAELTMPLANNPDRGYKALAVTDARGFQMVVPDTEATRDVFAAMNYNQLPESNFAAGIETKLARLKGHQSEGFEVRATEASTSRDERTRTTLVDISAAK